MRLNMNEINLIKAERGLNNKDISKLCNISEAWLSKVFNSIRVSPKMVNKLAKGLNVEVSEILQKEE